MFLNCMSWPVGFALVFFQAKINYDDLSTEVNKDLHLTFVEHAAGRREESW